MIRHTVIGRQIREMAAGGGIPILTAEVENREPFAESPTMGQSMTASGYQRARPLMKFNP